MAKIDLGWHRNLKSLFIINERRLRKEKVFKIMGTN